MTITGTVAQINALLSTNGTSTVSYTDNTDTPAASATLTLTINDNGNTGTGGPLTGSDTATINITAANDAPVATITPTSYSATEQTSLNLKNNGLSVSDVDGRQRLETRDAVGDRGHADGDRRHQRRGGQRQRHLVGDDHRHAGADQRAAQHRRHQHGQLQRQHRHAGGEHDADADDQRQRQHRPGGPLTGSDTATINITAVNDAPVATITPASYSATEQTSLNLKSNGLSVSDVDGRQRLETVTLSVTEGTLTVTAGTSGRRWSAAAAPRR